MDEQNGHRAADLEREIDDVRTDLVASVEQLEVALRARLDWRHYVRRRPLAFVGGAFVLGLVLGLR